MDDAHKLSIGKWVILLVSPLILLVVAALLQVTGHFAISATTAASGSAPPALIIINIFSLIAGTLSMVSLFLIPVWIIMLVKTINYNNATTTRRLSKTAAVIFAVLFGFWAWIYTYEHDKTKFWVNLALTIVTLTIWSIVAWIWAIIDTANKPADYYNLYPEFSAAS
jgi:hypothetical protein